MEIQLYKSQPYSSTAENKVAMSLHLHHVPHAAMLECRLEILLMSHMTSWETPSGRYDDHNS
jgi:hypothetical protein